MADAGYGQDTLLFNKLLREGKTLQVNDDDHPIAKKIKVKINDVLFADEISNKNFGSFKVKWHTAFLKKYKLLIKINQIRQKHFYFKPLV